MKIMMISSIFPPGFGGGYELSANEIAHGLKSKGHDICVVTSDHFLDYDQSITAFPVYRVLEYISPFFNYKVHHSKNLINDGFFINYRNIRLLSDLFIKFKPDSVIFFDSRGLGTLALLKYVVHLGFKPVLNFGDNIFADLDNPMANLKSFTSVFGPLNFLLKTRGIALSHSLVSTITKSLGFPLNQTIIPRWTKIAQSEPRNFTQQINTKTKFVFTSSFTRNKGAYIVLEAIKELIAEGYQNFTVDFYGSGGMSEFIHNIYANYLQDYAQYCGHYTRDEAVNLLANYDALLFPTWKQEPFGAVVAEAAAAGCVPIITNCIGAAEWLLDEVECLKIEPNISDLKAAMIKYMSLTPELKHSMSCRTLKAAKKFFNFSELLDATEKVIYSAVSYQNDKMHCPIAFQTAMGVLNDLWEKKNEEEK